MRCVPGITTAFREASKIKKHSVSIMKNIIKNDERRRSGIERREFSYTIHIPERRSCKDERRIGKGRRSGLDRRIIRKTSK
jgi:hypothetical protein